MGRRNDGLIGVRRRADGRAGYRTCNIFLGVQGFFGVAMTKAAEDFENIARRLKELEAEKQEALTGSSANVDLQKVGEYMNSYQINYEDFCG